MSIALWTATALTMSEHEGHDPGQGEEKSPKMVMAKFSITHHKQYLEKKNIQLRKSHGCFGPLAMEFAENAFPEAISGRKKWWKHVQAGLG